MDVINLRCSHPLSPKKRWLYSWWFIADSLSRKSARLAMSMVLKEWQLLEQGFHYKPLQIKPIKVFKRAKAFSNTENHRKTGRTCNRCFLFFFSFYLYPFSFITSFSYFYRKLGSFPCKSSLFRWQQIRHRWCKVRNVTAWPCGSTPYHAIA